MCYVFCKMILEHSITGNTVEFNVLSDSNIYHNRANVFKIFLQL